MEIRLKRLSLENFKGIQKKEIEFGAVTDIFGANATGKTTIADAFNWLLFNKDSKGVERFDIRPLDQNGGRIDNIEIKVAGVLDIDGIELVLVKIQKQNWVKKRGTDSVELQGNPNYFEINGIPKQEKEYRNLIDRYIQEDLFKMITNPQMFVGLPWKKQREILLKLVPGINDQEVAGCETRFLPLAVQLESFTVEELMAKAAKALKEWKKKQAELPSRIDEVSKSIIEVDLAEQELRKRSLLEQINENKKMEADAIIGFQDIEEISDEIMKFTREINDLERKENEKLEEQRRKINERKAVEGRTFHDAVSRQSALMAEINGKEKLIDTKQRDIEILREKYKELYAKEIAGNSMVCPVCMQDYPPEKIEEILKDFHSNKQKMLLDIQGDGKNASGKIAEIKAEKVLLENAVEEVKGIKIASNKQYDISVKELEGIPESADLSETPFYIEAKNKIKVLEEQMLKMDTGADYRKQLRRKGEELGEELAVTEKILSGAEANMRAEKRIKELQEEQKQVGQKVADQERELFLLEEFTRTKMNLLSTKINKQFKTVNWKLFELQLNGGMKETCECTVNGVPYGTLNSAGKIQAGIDIIHSLTELYEITAPIWIDNRESCTSIPDVDAQIINLYVAEDDSELRTEVA